MHNCATKAMRCVVLGLNFKDEYPEDYAAYVAAEREMESNESEQAELTEVIGEINAARQEFPAFGTLIGQSLAVGQKCWEGETLCEVIQAHTAQADWAPSAAPALFKVVHFGKTDNGNTAEEGSQGNPIKWTSGMTSINGQYYVEDGIVYLCNRDSGNALHYKISDLINLYFVKA